MSNVQQPLTPLEHLLEKNTPAPTPTDLHDNKSLTASPYILPTANLVEPVGSSVDGGMNAISTIGGNTTTTASSTTLNESSVTSVSASSAGSSVALTASSAASTGSVGSAVLAGSAVSAISAGSAGSVDVKRTHFNIDRQQQPSQNNQQAQLQLQPPSKLCGTISVKKFDLQPIKPSISISGNALPHSVNTRIDGGLSNSTNTPITNLQSNHLKRVSSQISSAHTVHMQDASNLFKPPKINVKYIEPNEYFHNFPKLYDFDTQEAW